MTDQVKLTKELLIQEFKINKKTKKAIENEYNITHYQLNVLLKKYEISNNRAFSGKGIRDLTNQKFGMLTAIDLHGQGKWDEYLWNCECECGKTNIVASYHLVTGQVKSCGCLLTKCKGYGEISLGYWTKMRRAALERNLSFEITIEEIWNLFLKQDRKCALTGVHLILGATSRNAINTASLDRINNDFGYTIDNVQWIHKKINIMKNHFNNDEYIFWSRLVSDYTKEKVIPDVCVSGGKCWFNQKQRERFSKNYYMI